MASQFFPLKTIFEINSTSRTAAFDIMKQKRTHHDKVISRNQLSHQLKVKEGQEEGQSQRQQEESTDLELQVNLMCLIWLKFC